jgi:hippurate hydrolase
MKNLAPIEAWQAEIAAIRQDIHKHPELGYEEVRTSNLVATHLKEWSVEVHCGLAGTGVVGIIQGRGGSTRAIGLRADMDALPMQEINTFAHASTVPGKMHGCGHDGHTAMLLSAARYLAQARDFDGQVIVIFQPAEEGGAGAQGMINDGLFERFPVEAVFGMHNWPGLPVGTFGVHPGPIMASSNEFRIVLTGRGTHAGMPHLGVDPVMAAVQLAQALQTIVSRNRDPLDAAVLSLTQIHTGSADNVVPESAVMRGTVRAFTTPVLDLIEGRMQELAQHIAQGMGCTAAFEFHRNYPATVNDSAAAAFSTTVLRDIFGAERVNTNVAPSMGAEDFAFMLAARPGSYVWLGAGDGSHRAAGHGSGPCTLHNGSYDFNDALLPIGATYWVELARRWLAPEKT